MAINATSSGSSRELIPAGNYIARCYQMLHIGTVTEMIQGQQKTLNKVRVGWELPTELKVFRTENGEEPCVISKEFTLSMHEKATLRKVLASWRGKDFTEGEAKCFDITKLLGVACMINIIHKPSKDGLKTYEEIAGVSPMPKGVPCPPQINKTIVLDYDNFSYDVYNLLPDFIKTKVQSSEEYKKLHSPQDFSMDQNKHSIDEINSNTDIADDLPF
jgi:hypothetical protein